MLSAAGVYKGNTSVVFQERPSLSRFQGIRPANVL